MPVTVTVNQEQVRGIEVMLSALKDGGKRATYSALTKTAATARTRIGQLIRSELNLKKSDADRMVYPTARPTEARPVAGIRISGKLISLSRFGAKQLKRRGVVATTFKSKGRQTYAASFINDGRLHGNPFSRQAQRGNRQVGPVSGRLPIHKLLGPSAADAATLRRGDLDAIVADLSVVLEKNLLSQIDRFTK